MIFFMFFVFVILLFSGMPVAFAMAISGTLAVVGLGDVSPLLIPQRMFMSLNSFPLLAIPFFILAGQLMNTGGITYRIVEFSKALIGHMSGSLAHVSVVSNIIMAGFSGSATADAVAIGSVMIPAMKKDGYPPEFTVGLNASAACIGPIIPPSLVMVVYGAITGLSIGKMFLGGFIPGLAIGIGLMVLVVFYARKNNWPRGKKSTIFEIITAFRKAFLALLAPVIILGGIITGIMTATEAGVIAAVYALVISLFVYKEITFKQIPKILVDSAINTAVPVVIISCASIFGWVLAREGFASAVSNFIFGVTTNVYISYLLIICILLIVGLFVEGMAALIIFVPVLFPIGNQLGLDPIHFALVIMITIMIGTITPPVGLQLYVASSIAKIPISKVIIWPFVIIMVTVLLIVTYIPSLVTYLPSIVFK